MSEAKVTSIREAETPSKRVHEPSKASDFVSMVLSSNLATSEKLQALVTLVDTVSGPGNGGAGQPPKVGGGTWAVIGLLALGLAAEVVPRVLPPDEPPKPEASEPASKEIEDLTTQVSGLREDLKSDRTEQAEFDYFLVEAIKDIETQSGANPEGLTSVNYLERAQEKRERK